MEMSLLLFRRGLTAALVLTGAVFVSAVSASADTNINKNISIDYNNIHSSSSSSSSSSSHKYHHLLRSAAEPRRRLGEEENEANVADFGTEEDVAPVMGEAGEGVDTDAAAAAAAATLPPTVLPREIDPDDYFRPGEERGSFDLVTKPYPIPVKTTTYVDFVFNLPGDLPDLFHVTLGEVINSQPLHLHHFVLTGCDTGFDEDTEVGLPFDAAGNGNGKTAFGMSCATPLGGWAPGAEIFGNNDLDTGVLLGRGIGIEAVLLNVHYTVRT